MRWVWLWFFVQLVFCCPCWGHDFLWWCIEGIYIYIANIINIYINIYIYIYIYIANKVGPRIPPCGIPLVTLDLFEQNVFFSPLCNTRHLFALKVMTPIAGPPLHIDYIHLYYVMIKWFAMNFLIISKHSTLTSKTVWQIIYIYIYIYI